MTVCWSYSCALANTCGRLSLKQMQQLRTSACLLWWDAELCTAPKSALMPLQCRVQTGPCCVQIICGPGLPEDCPQTIGGGSGGQCPPGNTQTSGTPTGSGESDTWQSACTVLLAGMRNLLSGRFGRPASHCSWRVGRCACQVKLAGSGCS